MKTELVEWPSYENGRLVHAGDVVQSFWGPCTVDSIELDNDGWRLWSYLDVGFGRYKRRALIDEGYYTDHPVNPLDDDGRYTFGERIWVPGERTIPLQVMMFVPSFVTDDEIRELHDKYDEEMYPPPQS